MNQALPSYALRLWLRGPVIQYLRDDVRESALAELRQEGLSVIELDASAWLHLQDFVLAMWNALSLPTDCPPALMNLDSFLVDENPDVGLAISIRRFDEFFRLDPHVAWQVLDMFASHSRRAIVGRKLWLVLVGCGKKYLKIKPVGARPVDGQ